MKKNAVGQSPLFEPSAPGPPPRGARIRPPGYPRAHCRYGCPDPVVWVKLIDALGAPKKNGKGKQSMVLINLGTVHDGNVVLEGAGRGRVLSPRESRNPDEQDLYEVHARTCKNTNTEVSFP